MSREGFDRPLHYFLLVGTIASGLMLIWGVAQLFPEAQT